jgi:hypothetical protein
VPPVAPIRSVTESTSPKCNVALVSTVMAATRIFAGATNSSSAVTVHAAKAVSCSKPSTTPPAAGSTMEVELSTMKTRSSTG